LHNAPARLPHLGTTLEIRLDLFHWSIICQHSAPTRLSHLGTTLEIRLDSLEIHWKFIRNDIRFIPLEYHYFSVNTPARLPHLSTTLEIRLDSLDINWKFIRN
jgi:hypothetical protein